jgi:DeoR/GlpR family transcriptional regulator of sugar metabolism
MDGINERQMKIITELNETGFVKVLNLCKTLNVSSVTIRKDLNFLEKKGLLYRTHGGASRQSLYAFERNVSEKEHLQVDQKKKIALAAMKLIDDYDYLIFASGTTIHYLSRLLEGFQKLTVLSSSLYVSIELCKNQFTDVIQLGGDVRKSSNSIVGPISEGILRKFSCNKLFLGVDGIDLKFGLTTSNALEAHLNKVMIECAERVIVLTDSSKIGKRSFGKIAPVEEMDVLITDSGISNRYRKELQELGIEVIIC